MGRKSWELIVEWRTETVERKEIGKEEGIQRNIMMTLMFMMVEKRKMIARLGKTERQVVRLRLAPMAKMKSTNLLLLQQPLNKNSLVIRLYLL